MERKFLVDEEELFRLLVDHFEMEMLRRDGVDNWSWYGESYQEVVEDVHPEGYSDSTFEDCAAAILDSNRYEVIELEDDYGL